MPKQVVSMDKKRVQIVMSTYNGEKYLKEQIDSILNQIDVDVKLFIRDDGSNDSSFSIASNYRNVEVKKGENIGFVKSFLTALDKCGESDYYAFSDQDDVWLNDKIISAIRLLEKENDSIPLLYCSTLQRVDENLNKLNIQNYTGLKLDLPSVLSRGRLAGCTFVFNKRLKDLVRGSSELDMHASHDSWILLGCIACGGKVIFDETPHILFRRYGTNTSIDGNSFKKRLKYEFRYFGKYKDNRYDTAIEILRFFDYNITDESRKFLMMVVNYKNSIHGKMRLAFSREIDCGIRASNLITRLTILCGNY